MYLTQGEKQIFHITDKKSLQFSRALCHFCLTLTYTFSLACALFKWCVISKVLHRDTTGNARRNNHHGLDKPNVTYMLCV